MVCRFGSIDGPQELYSFSDNADRPRKLSSSRRGKRDPMFFMSKSNILQAIRSSSQPKDVFEIARQGVALCEDWNSMRYLFMLDVPSNSHVDAWFGIAKSQPRLSLNHPQGSGSGARGYLVGGWLQYIIELDDRLIGQVTGPILTGR